MTEQEVHDALIELFPNRQLSRDELSNSLYRRIRSIAIEQGLTPTQYLASIGFVTHQHRMTEQQVIEALARLVPDKRIHSREQLQSLSERLYSLSQKHGCSFREYLVSLGYTVEDTFKFREQNQYDEFTFEGFQLELQKHVVNGVITISELDRGLYEQIRRLARNKGIKPHQYLFTLGFLVNSNRINWDARMPEILRMRQGGKSFREIGEYLGVSPSLW